MQRRITNRLFARNLSGIQRKSNPLTGEKYTKMGLKFCKNVLGTDLLPTSPKMQPPSPPNTSSPCMSSTSSYETSSTNSDFSGYISSETPPPEKKKGPYLKKSQAEQPNRGEGAETHQARFPTPHVITREGAETHQARSTPQVITGEAQKHIKPCSPPHRSSQGRGLIRI